MRLSFPFNTGAVGMAEGPRTPVVALRKVTYRDFNDEEQEVVRYVARQGLNSVLNDPNRV